MWKKPVKTSLLSAICETAGMEMILCDSNEQATKIFDQALEDVLLIQASRYINPRQPLPKSDKWYMEILPELDENRFKQFMRVSRNNFAFILSNIEESEGFKGVNAVKQLPISKQLAITLYKLGMDGSGSSMHNVAALFGIGDGGTVAKIVTRVMKAILELENTWIQWPNENERNSIKNHMSDKLPGCIGYIDGSHITLDEAPLHDPESYYTRKQRYAIQIQAVCDNQKKFRNISVGFTGSVHDARVFASSRIGRNTTKYLSKGEWIAGDSAYSNSRFVVTPFKRNVVNSGGSERQRKQFNRYFSGFRVNIECAFGMLKETFQSLKGVRVRVDRFSHGFVCDWITVCCILYNMILPSLDMDMSTIELVEDEEEESQSFPESSNEQRTSVFNFVISKLAL